jgi:flagellar hook-length control protein FliK
VVAVVMEVPQSGDVAETPVAEAEGALPAPGSPAMAKPSAAPQAATTPAEPPVNGAMVVEADDNNSPQQSTPAAKLTEAPQAPTAASGTSAVAGKSASSGEGESQSSSRQPGQHQLPLHLADGAAVETQEAPEMPELVLKLEAPAGHKDASAAIGLDSSPGAAKSAQAAPVIRIAAPPPPPGEAEFAQTNHPSIVTAVRGQLLPNGGTMQIRLDPPELGALQITVRLENGVMSASFQTSSDEATRLLSHSLASLKRGLESHGVSVDKIQVQQSPRDEQANTDEQSRQQQADDHSARQEQQRKEMLRRMWRRLSIGSDPLDMVA